MKEKIKQLKKYPMVLLFFGFIAIFTIIDMIIPQKSFSDFENRYLQKKPEFSLQSFYDNEFVPKYEKYVNDQFVLRNRWIDLKSRAEFYIGKVENNGIVYGKDKYMFDKIQTINNKQLNKNIESIKKYAELNKDENINLIIIPSSFEILKDKVPFGLNLINQKQIIEQIYSDAGSNINCINILNTLQNNSDKYIYYRTDHHWTTYGAYLAYAEFMKNISQEPIKLDGLKENKVDGFFGTYYSKSKMYKTLPDYITYYDFDIDELSFGDKSYQGLYDYDKFKVRDKYAAFLYGNNDLTIIKNKTNKPETEKTKILVVKDSFGNSFIPYLTNNYDEVYVLDLRSNSAKVSEIMKTYDFDEILIMYSLVNLSDDVNIVRMTY